LRRPRASNSRGRNSARTIPILALAASHFGAFLAGGGNEMPEPSPWWAPHVHADRRPFLSARGRITAALRRCFHERDFVEVEAAVLQVSPGNEAHLHAFATDLIAPDGEASRLYLHTSPEFAAKKLLAAGERRIFDFARVFRNRERGGLHHPEFTLLEWYRAGEPYEAVMGDCATLLAEAAAAAGTKALTFRGRCADPFVEPERMTVAKRLTVLPASTCWRRCRRRRPTAARWRPPPTRPA
jgi:lysyl-tRNA synthetase class 2